MTALLQLASDTPQEVRGREGGRQVNYVTALLQLASDTPQEVRGREREGGQPRGVVVSSARYAGCWGGVH